MPDPTDHEFHVMHHAIGAPHHAAMCDGPWRNYFYAGGRGADRDACNAMTSAGMMRVLREMPDGNVYFEVTPEGVKHVRSKLPKLARWAVETTADTSIVYAATRSKARTEVVLDIREAWGLSFGGALRKIKSVRRCRDNAP